MRSACYSRQSPAIEGREKTIMGGRICPASPVGQAHAEAGLQPVSFLLTEGGGRRRCPFMAEEKPRAQMAIAASTARRAFPRHFARADRLCPGSGNLGQRQDQGLSTVVLGGAAGAAG